MIPSSPAITVSSSLAKFKVITCVVHGCLIVGTLWASTLAWSAEGTEAIQFNRDIRPILAENCFACHGPDATARKADLRLDDRDVAVQSGAIVPGQPQQSGMLERIQSTDPELQMPPAKTHKEITAEQRALLERWITEGATYQAHWAFLPVPATVALPDVVDPNWVREPLDRFILSALDQRHWKPAPPATKEQWLRRVTMDLTGLPPTEAEVAAFLNDVGSDAMECVVRDLLSRPSFGERMANEWLDVARYADTFGYQADREMHVWPYREWVIRAFNQNLPYDDFIVWQTAGDLLDDPSEDQRLATAFNRLHRQTNEGGSIEEEFRTAYVADRVVTNGTAFLGLTLECARCHDHKFDPLTQRDFYSLAAYFAQIDEHGLYSHFTETAPTPALLLYQADERESHRQLTRQISEQWAKIESLVHQPHLPSEEAIVEPVTLPSPKWHFPFDQVAPTDDYRVTNGREGEGVEFSGDGPLVLNGAASFDRVQPFTFALWLRPADHAARRVVLHRSVAAEDAAFRGYALVLDRGHLTFSLVHFWPGNALRVDSIETLPVNEWSHVAVTYDGTSRAAGLRIFINGQLVPVTTVRDQLTRDITYRGEWGDAGGAELSLGARFRDVGFAGGAIDELRIYDQELTAREIAALFGESVDVTAQMKHEHWLKRHSAEFRAEFDRLRELLRQENEFVGKIRQIMTMSAARTPRPIHVLRRGAYDAPGDRVEPGVPTQLLALPPDAPNSRLGLAQWMVHPQNPLVSRVAVNRIWSLFWGRGLVSTLGDFGSQGDVPSHPELLDWLARDFIESGWNVKRLCQMIVLSSAYCQSSTPTDPLVLSIDPDNRWLARGPRHRWSAEQLRDQALAVSGLLVSRVGGPSVFPYQPTGLWEESGTGKTYTPSQGEGLYRRSLYTFWRRTSPPPAMTTFDATSREVCIAKRERTGTPLQALILLNDPQFVEAARVAAQDLIATYSHDRTARWQAAIRRCLSRPAYNREVEVLERLFAEQSEYFRAAPTAAVELLGVGESKRDEQIDAIEHAATTVVIQALMNHDEFVHKY